MNHAILERKLVLSWHMKGRILHTAYAVYIVQKDLPPPSKQLAAPASLLPSFPAARSARMRRSKFIGNGHYCSWFWFDSKKSQIIESTLNVYFVHLLCTWWSCDDFHWRQIPWHAFHVPRGLLGSTKIQDPGNRCFPYFIDKMAMANAIEWRDDSVWKQGHTNLTARAI